MMTALAGYLAGTWVVPEFCLTLSGLLLGTGLGLLIKGWFHHRRRQGLLRLAGVGNKPGAGKKQIPAAMTMGKRLWNPSVFFFSGLLLCALAGVVFWPGLGRTDYARIQQLSSLVICLATFLFSLALVLIWSPAGLLPFLAFAATVLAVHLGDAAGSGTPVYLSREASTTHLVPEASDLPLLSVEYLSGTPAVWRLTALGKEGQALLGEAYRSVPALPDQDLVLDFSNWELPVFLRPFAAPLILELELRGVETAVGTPSARQARSGKSPALRSLSGNIELTLQKVVSAHEGTVIYMGGATRFMDLRLLPGP